MTWFISLYSLSSSSSSSIQGPTVSAKKVCLLVCQVTIVSWCYSYLTVSFSRRYRAVRLQRFVLSSVILALLSMMTWQYNLTLSPLFFLQEPTFPPSKVSLVFVPFALSLLWNMKSHALPVTLLSHRNRALLPQRLVLSLENCVSSMLTWQHYLTLSPFFFVKKPTAAPTKVCLVICLFVLPWCYESIISYSILSLETEQCAYKGLPCRRWYMYCCRWWPDSIILHYHLSFSCRSQLFLLHRLVL